jgi:hypothetical protein
MGRLRNTAVVPIFLLMITPAGMESDDQASRLVLKNEFLARAKSLSNLREVFRSSLVTQILTDALAVGLRLEAEIFEEAYGDPAGSGYWKTQLSEPLLVGKFAKVLAVHAAERAADLTYATEAIIKGFREAAQEGEEWFVAETEPLLAFAKGRASCEDSVKVKIYPRAAVSWLLSKPKREHLVADSLRSFLQVDQVDGKPRPVTEKTAERFVDSYINSEQGQGRRPTLKGLEAAAKKANLRGGREYLRAAFHQYIETKRGRPTKAPEKIAKN